MKYIELIEIIPYACPLGKDDCRKCDYFDGVRWGIDAICNYEPESRIRETKEYYL